MLVPWDWIGGLGVESQRRSLAYLTDREVGFLNKACFFGIFRVDCLVMSMAYGDT